MPYQYLGLWLLVAMAFNIWALLSVFGARPGALRLLFWSAILLCLPVIGFAAWYLLGPRAART